MMASAVSMGLYHKHLRGRDCKGLDAWGNFNVLIYLPPYDEPQASMFDVHGDDKPVADGNVYVPLVQVPWGYVIVH